MRSKFKVYPYKMGSKSAKALAEALGCKQIKHTGAPMRFSPPQRIINWGASKFDRDITYGMPVQITLNHPSRVVIACNKLTAFQRLATDETINFPSWTSNSNTAYSWWVDGSEVVIRTKLTGHSGDGIILSSSLPKDDDSWITTAPLYTRYIKKKSEFRVHVVRNEVIDIQQKKKSSTFVGEADTRIRNHQNGWVYCRENLEIPNDLKEQAIKSVRALGLDFGAVDLIYNQHQNKSYVLEVNCAPGLEGATVDKYKEAFLRLL